MDKKSAIFDSRFSIFLLISIVALFAYFPILFIPYSIDSVDLIAKRAQTASWGNLISIFSPAEYNKATGIYSYRPLTALLFIVDMKIFAAKPLFSHALQLILHIASSVFLAALVLKLFNSRMTAIFAGIIFAGHPITTEAVNCAGFRADLLAVFFILLSGIFTLKYSDSLNIKNLAASLLFALAALLSKETGAVSLILNPLLIYFYKHARADKNQTGKTMLTIIFSTFIIFSIYFFIWKNFKFAGEESKRLGDSGIIFGLLNFIRVFIEIYLPRWIIPINLKTYHEFSASASFSDPRLLFSLLASAALIFASITASLISRASLLGALWIIIAFIPTSSIIPIPDPIGERMIYLPHVGFSIFAAGIIEAAFFRKNRSFKLALTVLILTALPLMLMTWRRTLDWRNEPTLNIANFEHDEIKSQFALQSLGALRLIRNQGSDVKDAEKILTELTIKYPENPEGWRLLSIAKLAANDFKSASTCADKAAELAPLSYKTIMTAYECAKRLGGENSEKALTYKKTLEETQFQKDDAKFIGLKKYRE